MKTIPVQKLSECAFKRYGSYADMLHCGEAETTGPKSAEIVFFRDMNQQELGGASASYSTCRMMSRPFEIGIGEYHNRTCETAVPLDGDAVMWFAPATADGILPVDRIEAFFVPRGTVVTIRPGVWHHAAFAIGDQPLNVLIVLPERTYTTDCFVAEIPEAQRPVVDPA